MHTQLHPALCQAWRTPQTLQLGLSERAGSVLDGLRPEDVPILEALANGVHPRSRIARLPRYRALLALLTDHGLLLRRSLIALSGTPRRRLAPDAAAWSLSANGADTWPLLAARNQRRVVVQGHGRVSITVANTLVAAGVGDVRVSSQAPVEDEDLCPAGPHTQDRGRPLCEVIRVDRPSARMNTPDVVVLVEPDAADAADAADLVNSGTPHLSVVIREGGIRVGPLVEPENTACLRCIDLHRTDADPAWPTVLTQLLRRRTTQRGELGAVAVLAQELASGQLAASWAALQVLTVLDGLHPPASRGATFDFDLPDALPVYRAWPPHPACGCTELV